MAFSLELQTRILAALNGILPSPKVCPMCHSDSWQLIDGFLALDMHDELEEPMPPVGPRTYPCVGITCNVCGYVALFQFARLGLLDVVKRELPAIAPLGLPGASNG